MRINDRRGHGKAPATRQEPRELRIAVCVPGGDWNSAMGHSVANMIAAWYEAKYANPRTLKLFAVEGSILPDVRNLLVTQALQWRATHLLLIDSDMQLPETTLIRLLAHQRACVGVNYVQRRFPAKPNAYLRREGESDEAGRVPTLPESTGLQAVDHLGMGCVLLDARVFTLIEAPAFEFETARDRAGDGTLLSWHTVGEDVVFCRKLREAGIEILLDHDLSKGVYHVGEFRYGHEHYEPVLSAAREAIAEREG